jgi:hypothetical protein
VIKRCNRSAETSAVDRGGIDAVAAEIQRVRADVGSKDLGFDAALCRGELLEQHCERIGLLAGAATRRQAGDLFGSSARRLSSGW